MKQRLVGVRRVITPQRDMFAQLVGNVVDLPGITTRRRATSATSTTT